MSGPTGQGARLRCAAVVAAALLAGALGGCATGDVTPRPTVPVVVVPDGIVRFDSVSVSKDVAKPPTFTIGDDTQDTHSFISYDIVTGTGATARPTDRVTVQYVGRSAKTKRQFDSSWDRGRPYTFVPARIAFSAFHDGVPGMRVGGRRLVIVPAALAFGDSPPAGAGVGPGESLVFVLDLVSVG